MPMTQRWILTDAIDKDDGICRRHPRREGYDEEGGRAAEPVDSGSYRTCYRSSNDHAQLDVVVTTLFATCRSGFSMNEIGMVKG